MTFRVLKKERLVERRKLMGFTQEELARELGVTSVTVSRYERGEFDPNPAIMDKLSTALQTSVDYLIGLSDNVQGQSGDSLSADEEQWLRAYRENNLTEVMEMLLNRAAKKRDQE